VETISVNKFRDTLREHVDKVISEHDLLKVTRRNGADFVVFGTENWGTRAANAPRTGEPLIDGANRPLREDTSRLRRLPTDAGAAR
jgi:PHD/YefM family antitoxin component YafN of YafNO toxin-antitoxin module